MKGEPISSDLTNVWAYSWTEKKWYCAKQIWSSSYAEHLRTLGYEVERAVKSPTGVPV